MRRKHLNPFPLCISNSIHSLPSHGPVLCEDEDDDDEIYNSSDDDNNNENDNYKDK